MIDISKNKEKNILMQIQKFAKTYSYSVRDWDIMTIDSKFSGRKEEDIMKDYDENADPEIYIPTYQRQFIWSQEEKSKFIESLFMNLPIPFIFLNNTPIDDQDMNEMGVLEIIDGLQRLSTIKEFMDNDLRLSDLEYIQELNGCTFDDLSNSLRKRFKLIPIRVVIFNGLDIKQRQEMFNRINTTGNRLKGSEERKGVYGEFYTLLAKLSENQIFNKLAPLSPGRKNREEGTELILRYFAYTEKYEHYNHRVKKFLDDYMREKNNEMEKLKNLKQVDELKEKKGEMEKDFLKMLQVVEKNLPYGFRKKDKGKSRVNKNLTSRVYFESIAVGIGLALKQTDASLLRVEGLQKLLASEEYNTIISSDAANNKNKFKERIEIIRNYLLNQ